MDQVRPLVGLEADEDRAAERREQEEHLARAPGPPFSSHSSAFTIVTLEQISRNVISGGQLDAEDARAGLGQSPLAARRAP